MESEELQEQVEESPVLGSDPIDVEPVPFPFEGGEAVEITSELQALILISNNIHALWITVVVLGVIYIFNTFVRRS